MPLGKLEITGLTGPSRPITSHFVDVRSVTFDFTHNVATVVHALGVSEFDLAGIANVTDKITYDEHSLKIG